MAVDFTVAVCTYNGETRLPEVLERLRSQVCPDTIQWEAIVVDNNSCDRTFDIVRQYQANWPQNVTLKYCLEPRQGLGFARQKAIELAQGTWVGFLDDDNLPASDWVESAHRFGSENPKAGVYGGYIQARYETDPPAQFHRISRFLAIGGADRPVCYSCDTYAASKKHVYPPGAGVVVRRNAWLKHVPKNLKLQGRVSGLNLPGDDVEAFTYLRNAGWEIWHNPAMRIEHAIPKQRLELGYIKQMMWRTGLSRHHTRYLAFQQKYWLMLPLYWLNDLRKLVKHCWQYSLFINDIVSTGERQLILGSLASPFYFLFWQLRRRLSPPSFNKHLGDLKAL